MKALRLVIGLILCGVILGMSSCQDQQTIDELAKFKQAETLKATNIELAKAFYKHLDAVQLDSLREIVAPDAKLYYQSGDPISFSDIEPLIEMFYTSFPDYIHEIEDIMAVDDKVVCRILYTGTYTNSFMGMSPSGEKFMYKGIQIIQFSDGKVTKFWGVEDELALMTQLGLELTPME
jgi:predicted ester cyclase